MLSKALAIGEGCLGMISISPPASLAVLLVKDVSPWTATMPGFEKSAPAVMNCRKPHHHRVGIKRKIIFEFTSTTQKHGYRQSRLQLFHNPAAVLRVWLRSSSLKNAKHLTANTPQDDPAAITHHAHSGHFKSGEDVSRESCLTSSRSCRIVGEGRVAVDSHVGVEGMDSTCGSHANEPTPPSDGHGF